MVPGPAVPGGTARSSCPTITLPAGDASALQWQPDFPCLSLLGKCHIATFLTREQSHRASAKLQQLPTSGTWLQHKDEINCFALLYDLDRQLDVLTGSCLLMLPQTAAIQFSAQEFPSLFSEENETSWKSLLFLVSHTLCQ